MNKSTISVLSSLRIANIAGKKEIMVPNSDTTFSLLNLLYRNGYIAGYKSFGYDFRVFLKYSRNYPNIRRIKLYSVPSRRVYSSYEDLIKKFSLSDFIIVSTREGLMSLVDSFQLRLGGQVVCKIN
jgi:small subunit ribosomal protein S8